MTASCRPGLSVRHHAPKYPFMFPQRELDAVHPEIFIDRNRCILCGRCVRASQELDGKHVFGFVGRGVEKRWRSMPTPISLRPRPKAGSIGRGLPDRFALGQAGRVSRACWPAEVRPSAHRLRDRSSAQRIGSESWPNQSRDDLSVWLLRLSHVLARYRRAHSRAGGAGRLRSLTHQRHQDDRGQVEIGLIEGGCCNEENVKVLQDFRQHCKVLISVGDCAINGGSRRCATWCRSRSATKRRF